MEPIRAQSRHEDRAADEADADTAGAAESRTEAAAKGQTMSDILESIKALRQQALTVLHQRHSEHKDMHDALNDQCAITLNHVMQMLYDAELQARHPMVKRMAIAYFNGSDYTHAAIPFRAAFVCGIEPGMSERVTPAEGVPDCPECLAILEQQAVKS